MNIYIDSITITLGEEPKQKPVLLLTLPEFRKAYTFGQEEWQKALPDEKTMTDVDVMDELRRLVTDGFFTQEDEKDIQFAIGSLLGFLSAGQ